VVDVVQRATIIAFIIFSVTNADPVAVFGCANEVVSPDTSDTRLQSPRESAAELNGSSVGPVAFIGPRLCVPSVEGREVLSALPPKNGAGGWEVDRHIILGSSAAGGGKLVGFFVTLEAHMGRDMDKLHWAIQTCEGGPDTAAAGARLQVGASLEQDQCALAVSAYTERIEVVPVV
jgi:hypothetical protein